MVRGSGTAAPFELLGVLSVAALARSMPADGLVGLGSGYGYVPLVLPVLGLAWPSTRTRLGSSGR